MVNRVVARQRSCRVCGVSPITGYKFCSERCKLRFMGVRPLSEYRASIARPTCTCQHCAKAFRPKRVTSTSYCSRECAFAAQKAVAAPRYSKVQPCEICGAFQRGTARSCPTCRQERARRLAVAYARRSYHPRSRECPGCGVSFTPLYGHSHATYCEPRCARRTIKANRRPRRLGATLPGVTVGRIRVFERAGWKCVYCGVDTPRALMRTLNANAPTADHITPFARGGKHHPNNVICACRRCNCMKRDLPMFQFARVLHAAIAGAQA